jgi:hypothetical protein
MNINRITMDDVGRATQFGSLDAALQSLMAIAGIETGDVAAQIFHGFDWGKADQWRRVQQVARWISAEKAFCED